jgi:Mrp family chromosome partitioning ATPase/capsular polysaccharide biosynthesis protein
MPELDEPVDVYALDIGPLAAVGRHKLLAAGLVLAALAVSLLAALLPSRPHEATVDMALSDPRGGADFGQNSGSAIEQTRFTLQRGEYLRSTPVLQSAARALGDGVTAGSLRKDVTVKTHPSRSVLTVTARADSATRAVAIVNAVVGSYRRLTTAQAQSNAKVLLENIRARLSAAEADLAALLRVSRRTRNADYNAAALGVANLVRQQIQVSVATAQYGPGVSYVNPASDNGDVAPLAPVLARDGVLGLAVGVLLALGLCWLLAFRRPLVANAEELSRLTGLPILSEIKDTRRGRAVLTRPASMPVADYQRAVTGLRSQVERGVVAVVSACRQDGRSITTAQLAVGAARDGLRIALVDTDLRGCGASSLFDIENATPGLGDALRGAGAAGVECERALDSDVSIAVVPPGSGPYASAASAYRSERMRALLADLAARFDYVFLDTPAALAAPEAAAVALVSDAVVMLARSRGPARSVVRLWHELALQPTPVVGALLTRVRGGSDEVSGYGEVSDARGLVPGG